jgi:DNA-binding Lrp family transcriptional regulator
MQPTQREVELLRLLGETGSGRIQALSRQLDVSEETVRRAVRRLESRGLVTKLHGGVALKGWRREPNFTQRFSENPAAKRRIAAAAAGLIPDGASLFLDVGSTTAYVAEALRGHRDLMVVTNSLFAAHSLTGLNGNRVYMAGASCGPMTVVRSVPAPLPLSASFASALRCFRRRRSTPGRAFCCTICARPSCRAASLPLPSRAFWSPMRPNSAARRRSG